MENQIPPTQTGVKRIFKAAGYSWQGICYAWRNEAAFRQESILFIVGLLVALITDTSAVEKVLLIGSLGLVVIIEILNSAVEAVVDRFGAEFHPLSKAAKDMGSAAVLLMLVLAGLTWLLIYLPL
ncbi:MAG: diacylglycerol kinase [Pseudomonadales bacterium]